MVEGQRDARLLAHGTGDRTKPKEDAVAEGRK
jgi:hypothetical protein